jgi:hypothetical protein
MVGQVHVVSILMIVNGALVSLMGVVLAAVGPTMFAMIALDKRGGGLRPQDEGILAFLSAFYVALGLMVLAAGVINIVAGARSVKFRGRGLALTALFFNLVPMPTCYCLPTCLGIMIWGLIVFFQADVARAFELGERGVPAEEIRRRMVTGHRSYRANDEDDDEPDYERG